MSSTTLDLESKQREYKGEMPFVLGDDWIMLKNAESKTVEIKEKLLNFLHNENFESSEILVTGNRSLYYSILCIQKGASQVDLYCENENELNQISEFIESENLRINIISEIDFLEKYDAIINSEENTRVSSSDSIIIDLDIELEIKFPSNEIEAEFNISDVNLPLFDIFILLNEYNLKYLFLRNWEILTEGVDEFDDLTIDIYMEQDAKRFFEKKIKTLDLENRNGWLLQNIKLDDELELKIKIITKEINTLPEDFLNAITESSKEIESLKVLNNKEFLNYLIFYVHFMRGGLNRNVFERISDLIDGKYSEMYEWRTHNYSDILKLYKKKFELKDDLAYLDTNINYLPNNFSLIHNIIDGNILFRVYSDGKSQIRQASPTLASRDIYQLELNDINTEIIEETEKYITYKLNSDDQQIILNIFDYLDILQSENWKNGDPIENKSVILTKPKNCLILGMHRSGTSLLASVVEGLGVHLGTHILGKNDSNPNGHFEDQEFIDLNDKILNSLGFSWDNPPRVNEISELNIDINEEIKALIETKNKNLIWGWKDPRTSITLPYYQKFIENQKIIIVKRNKEDVAKSLQKRNGFTKEKANNIYDQYIESIEEIKKNNEFLEIQFETIFTDFDSVVNKIIAYLDIKTSETNKDNLRSFVKNKSKINNTNLEAASILTEVNEAIVSRKFNTALNKIVELIAKTDNLNKIGNLEYLRAFCLFQLGKYAEAYAAAHNETIINPENEKAFELLEKIKSNIPDIERKFELPIEFSIIIPVFNKAQLTKNCLDSILKYTKDYNYEIIIVNNNSTDNTEEILNNYKNIFKNFKVINNKSNLGFAKAINQGLNNRSSKHAMLLNNDTVVTKSWANSLLEEIKNGAGICGSLLLYPNSDFIQHYYVKIGTEDGKTIAPYHVHQYHDRKELSLQSKEVSAVNGAAMMISDELLKTINGFDENYLNGLEDIDFCFEAKKQGFRITNSIDSVIYHYESMSEGRHDNDIKNWQYLNKKWLGKIVFDEEKVDTSLNVHRIETQKKLNYDLINNSIEKSLGSDIKNELINPNDKIDFSIIIPVHNNLEYTQSCIDNIYKSSALYAIEVIIINNNSDDNTSSYLNALGDQVIVIENNENKSFSIANNQGAKIAKGDYLVFLNNDVDVKPGWLESLEYKFKSDDNVGIQGAKLLYPNGLIQHAGIAWGPVAKDLNLHFHIYLTCSSEAPQVNISREYQMVTGALLAIRKELFDKLNGFDENYYFGHEDLDLCLKARKYGSKVWYNHNVVATHHESITKKSEGIEKFERFIKEPNSNDAKNHEYFLSKWEDSILVDSLKFYLEDRMYGLLGDLNKYELFENKLKEIFNLLKDLPENIYQEKANKVSEILFQREGLDFVKNPGLILNVQYDLLEKAIDFLKGNESKKKTILITMFGWNESGGGTILPKNMAIDLAKDGYDVTVFYAALEHPKIKDPYYFERSKEFGVNLIGVFNRDIPFVNLYKPEKEIYDEIIVEHFSNLLDELNPDFIHFQNFVGLSFGIAKVAYEKGFYSSYIPYNYHLIDPALYMIENNLEKWVTVDKYKHSQLIKNNPELTQAYKKRDETALELLNKWVSNIQAVSSRVKDIFVEFGADANKFTVINQISKFTHDLNIDNNYINKPIKFGFIGGIMPHKGVHNILAASSALKENSCEISLYGFINDSYKQILDGIKTNININYYGEYSSDQMEEIANNIDVAILPSIWEDCGPHVISECLSLGIPILAPNIGGFSDYIEDGKNGFIYDFKNINSLAELMQKLIDMPELVKELKSKAYLTYSYNDYLELIKRFYINKPELNDLNNFKTIFKDKLKQSNKAKAIDEKRSAMNRESTGTNQAGGFSNNKAKGKLPSVLPSPLKINLGCGNDFRKDFLNIDLFSDNPNVIYMDVRKLDFQNNSVDLILASDILEHFSHREISDILNEWSRVLKPGGAIIIRCPNLRLQIDAYIRGDWNAEVASYMIFGGQTNPGDYHAVGFDEKSIKNYLQKAGLEIEHIENEDLPQNNGFINLNMTVKARKNTNLIDNKYETDKSQFSENKKEFKEDKKEQTKYKINEDDIELNIVWEGSQFLTHSLALINREICYNIIRSNNSNLNIIPYEDDQLDPDSNSKLALLKQFDVRYKEPVDESIADLPYVWIRHQWPPKNEAPIGAKWIVMQPWEYTSHLAESMDAFKNAEEIWTPSNYSRNTFINSGIDPKKVQIIPNGIDPVLFKPDGNKYNLKTNKKLKLLFIGGSIMRKGIDILLNVYLNIFNKNDDVCLIIKDFGTGTFYEGQNMSLKIKEYQNNINYPEIEYITEELSAEDMAGLYRACDVFVSPYRGEGFCLPALEAMACGLPAIVTDGGATDDFVDESCGWLISSEYKAIGDSLNGRPTEGEVGWLDPNQDVLAYVLDQIYKNPSQIFSKGLIASYRARKYFTWRNTTLKIFSRLDSLYDTNLSQKAVANLKEHTDIWRDLGKAEQLFSDGNYEESAKLFNELTESDLSEKVRSYCINVLILLNIENNNLEIANNYVKKADLIDPKNIDLIYLKSKIKALENNLDEALEIINPLVENWVINKWSSMMGLTLDDLITYMGDIIFDMADYESAIKIYNSALEHNPINLNALFGAGMCFKANEEIEKAIELFETALKVDENYLPASMQLEELKD